MHYCHGATLDSVGMERFRGPLQRSPSYLTLPWAVFALAVVTRWCSQKQATRMFPYDAGVVRREKSTIFNIELEISLQEIKLGSL